MPLETQLPVVLGSLNRLILDAIGSGSGFEIGDLVNVRGARGREGIARVSNVSSITGVLSFTLEDGGYGYTENSEVLISEKILTVANTELEPLLFETIYQPIANINYFASNGTFAANDVIYTYHANNDPKGTATIISVEESNSTAGFLLIEVLTGSMNDNSIFTAANAIGANSDTYTNLYATGNLIGWAVNSDSSTLKLGVMSINNEFFEGHFIYGTDSGITDELDTLSIGSGGNVTFSNDFLYEEEIELYTDTLAPYTATQLNAADYAFPAVVDPAENVSTSIINALSTANYTFGAIQTLVGLNPGTDYNEAPYIFIYEPVSYAFARHDSVLRMEDVVGAFIEDEVVNQDTTNARGLVKFANSTFLVLKDLRVSTDNIFQAGYEITGENSGATANVAEATSNSESLRMGYNAVVNVQVQALEGAVTELEVVSSGFGFVNGETVSFSLRE